MNTTVPWQRLEAAYEARIGDRAHRPASAHEEQDLKFASGRLTEGRAIGEFLTARFSGPVRVLDLGSGNGGVSFGVANFAGTTVVALDHQLNLGLQRLGSDAGLRILQVLASGEALPFREDVFTSVLCLETIEHVSRPALLGGEIIRVLRAGGLCMLTTPPRLKYLFRRDPHFGIPGLLALPDRLQKLMVTRVFRRTSSQEYDVQHIYSYAGSIARFFPGRKMFQGVGRPPSSKAARMLWQIRQRFAWERLLIWKIGA
ncbi:MAG TPA: class I SAM-dependent methyltransferase [Thermoanaerobaculia bacterium]|jgi:ubiquinone/menaquinone biosynthesis C-methylase UbiE|nr:class I SAM-dependent methyltransferase [Thermoanaerobaculia bacterium]